MLRDTETSALPSVIVGAPLGVPNLSELDERLEDLRQRILAGKLSLPFALGGVSSIIDGNLRAAEFPTWRTVRPVVVAKFGGGNPREEYKRALELTGKNFYVHPMRYWGDWKYGFFDGDELLEEFDAFELVRVTPTDLGFGGYKEVRLGTAYKRAAELGLLRCPVRVALWLRATYLDQPYGEWLVVATEELCRISCEAAGLSLRLGRGLVERNALSLYEGTHDIFRLDGVPLREKDRIDPNQELIFMKQPSHGGRSVS